jgi:threonine dehydrogenase-like Zn-dependent dehydrogenase
MGAETKLPEGVERGFLLARLTTIRTGGPAELFARATTLAELGRFDLVVEAAGDAQLMADALGLLRRSGVLCLLGIDGRERTVSLDGHVLAVDTVLENRVVFGSVNAQRQDWIAAVAALDRARERWQDALEALVGLRVPLDRFDEAFAFRGGKAVLQLR